MNLATPRRGPRGFTLTELLLVIAIFLVLLGVGVPAFNAITYSSQETSADATVRAALRAARDAAVRSGPGRDAAAVFFFEPRGRASIVTCISAGRLQDWNPNDDSVSREVFVPAEGMAPAPLPPGWVISGLATPGTIDPASPPRTYVPQGWYHTANYPAGQRNWVFPETGFHDLDEPDEGRHRQTFMVRFVGGSGLVDSAGGEPVLVYSPSPSLKFRGDPPFNLFRADQVTSPLRYAQSVLLTERTPPPGNRAIRPEEKRQLLGDVSSDTVLARPVPEIAVYNLQRLAGAIGARRMNAQTGCLYAPPGSTANYPHLDPGLFSVALPAANITARVNAWIEATDPVVRETQSPAARIFTITRRGEVQVMLQEVSP